MTLWTSVGLSGLDHELVGMVGDGEKVGKGVAELVAQALVLKWQQFHRSLSVAGLPRQPS